MDGPCTDLRKLASCSIVKETPVQLEGVLRNISPIDKHRFVAMLLPPWVESIPTVCCGAMPEDLYKIYTGIKEKSIHVPLLGSVKDEKYLSDVLKIIDTMQYTCAEVRGCYRPSPNPLQKRIGCIYIQSISGGPERIAAFNQNDEELLNNIIMRTEDISGEIPFLESMQTLHAYEGLKQIKN